jgi:hypothetical protein
MKDKTPDPLFDGHLEKSLKDMMPEEKLDYIWSRIELRNYINKNVIKRKSGKIGKNINK